MATVQKTSKINFYKFVQVKEPSSAAIKGDSSAAVAKSINSSTKAINNLGATVNSLVKIMDGLKAVAIGQLEAERLKSKKFEAQYTTPQKKEKDGGGLGILSIKTPSFLEGILNILGGLFKAAVITPALEWLADERNKKKVEDAVTAIWKLIKFVADFTKWGVTSIIDGLYDLLKDDATPLERFGGLIEGLTGLGGMMLGIRWLTNPGNIIRDFGGVLKFFHKNLLSSRAGMIRRMGALGLAVGAGVLIYKGVESFNDVRKNNPAMPGPDEVNAAAEEKAKGGSVKKLPQRANGGWINGPQSGYPVSLDGGRSTSFIGHGKEYVARKANGGAFVVPFDTPFTKRNPNLTQKRMGEAKSMGYDVPGFAAGGNLNKQIYLHWTAGSYNHKAGPYHATVQGNSKIYRHLPYSARTGHTYNRNSGNVGLSVASMGGTPWKSYPPKESQIDAMMLEAANIAKKWGWKPGDVNIKRVMTHAEAGSNKDGRNMHDNYGPVMWGGTGERWDWLQTKKTDKAGTGGDKLRQKMKKFMGDPNAKEVPEAGGLTSKDAMDGDGVSLTEIPLTLSGASKRLVGGDGNFLAEVNRVAKRIKAHPADLLGLMASESGLDPKADNGTHVGLIQFSASSAQSVGTTQAKLKNMTRAEQMKYVEKYLVPKLEGVPLDNGKVNAGNLYAAVFLPAFAAKGPNYILAKKGGFTDSWGHHPASWYSGNQGLDLNNDGAITIKELGKRIADKKKSFGINGGTMTISATDLNTVSPADHEDSNVSAPSGGNYGNSILGKVSPTAGMFAEDVYGRARVGSRASGARSGSDNQASAAAGASNVNRAGGNGTTVGTSPGSTISPAERRESANLQQATEQRNTARQMMNQRTQEMISTALDAVGKQNGANAQVIALAQQTIQQVMAQSQPPSQPQFIPTGGGGGGGISASGIGRAIGGNVGAAVGGTAAAILNSTNNPLRGIFR